ncbi:MAG TPA: kelch repeat-containing protein [Candidatus Dormibacteraeota bacterium]|nr:kelch repeat-containing protein [Candidatus Dormibacteraeota bacterium]
MAAVQVLAGGPTGGWSDAGSLSTQRPGSDLSVLLTDGRVLVAGASGADYSGLGNVDLYDPAHGWSLGPQMDGDPQGAVAAPLPNASALIAGGTPWFGGFDGPGPDPVAKAMTYDPATAAWKSAPSMSRARNNATASPLADGRVLVTGGYDRKVVQLPNPNQQPFCCLRIDLTALATSEIFDPKTRSWSVAGSLGHARYWHQAITLKGGLVLVVGGEDQQRTPPTYLASAERFDPSTGTWAAAGDIGVPRTDFTLTGLADGRALLAGGLAPDGLTVLRSTLLYDPVKNAWSQGPDMEDVRTQHAAALLMDGRVLVTGGVDHLGRLATSEIFDPAASAWIPTGALKTARSNEVAVALHDGRVLVAGGRGSKTGLADAEIFDPDAAGASPDRRTVAGPGTWVVKPTPPAGLYSQDVHLLKDGRALVLPNGGYPDYVAQIYDPRSSTWTQSFTRTADQQFIAGTAMSDDRVLLVTLDSEGLKPGKAEVIDPVTGVSRAATSPGTLGSARLDLLPDGRVWLTGGPAGDSRTLFYDASADRWSAGPDVPSDLYVGTVTWIPGGRVLVGGIVKAMILDPTSGAWSDVGGFPGRWNNYSATALPNGDVLFAGGTEDEPQADGRLLPVGTTRVMRWNHNTGLLEPARDMTSSRPFHSTVVLRDGRVLFAGGVASGDSDSDPVSTAELYDPVKNTWISAQSMPEARSQMTGVLLADGTVLEVGGWGLFNPASSILYRPEGTAKPTAAVAPSAQRAALIEGVLILAAAGLISWALLSSARRRSRSARLR